MFFYFGPLAWESIGLAFESHQAILGIAVFPLYLKLLAFGFAALCVPLYRNSLRILYTESKCQRPRSHYTRHSYLSVNYTNLYIRVIGEKTTYP